MLLEASIGSTSLELKACYFCNAHIFLRLSPNILLNYVLEAIGAVLSTIRWYSLFFVTPLFLPLTSNSCLCNLLLVSEFTSVPFQSRSQLEHSSSLHFSCAQVIFSPPNLSICVNCDPTYLCLAFFHFLPLCVLSFISACALLFAPELTSLSHVLSILNLFTECSWVIFSFSFYLTNKTRGNL